MRKEFVFILLITVGFGIFAHLFELEKPDDEPIKNFSLQITTFTTSSSAGTPTVSSTTTI